jgi:rhodanese-related sulfurtransferase
MNQILQLSIVGWLTLGVACWGYRDDLIPIVLVDGENEQQLATSDCGIFAMAVSLEAQGRTVEVTDYLNSQFVGSQFGSTPTQLLEMAERVNMKAHFVERMTWQHVRDSNSPVLMLLRDRDSPSHVGHWITFLGMEGRKAIFFDSAYRGDSKIFEIPPSDILLRWQGQAIVFDWDESSSPQKIWASFWRGFKVLLPIALTSLFAGIITQFFRRNTGLWFCCITIAATLWFGSSESILIDADSRVCQFLDAKYSNESFPLSSVANAKTRFGEAIHLVDARSPVDFFLANLDGSVNLHVSLSMQEIEKATENWEKNGPVVVYCVGEHCSWSTTVARRLRSLGFENVFISNESISDILIGDR